MPGLLEFEDWFLARLGCNCKQGRKLIVTAGFSLLVVHQQMGKDEESYHHQAPAAPLLLKIKYSLTETRRGADEKD